MLDTTSLLLQHLKSQPEDTVYYIQEKPYNVGYLINEIQNDSLFGTKALNTLISEVISGLMERKYQPYVHSNHWVLSQMMVNSDSALSIIKTLNLQTNRVTSGVQGEVEDFNKVLRHPAIKPLVSRLHFLLNQEANV